MSRQIFSLLLLTSLFVGQPAFALSTAAAPEKGIVLQGTITDSSGAFVPDASVALEDDQARVVVHVVTDTAGHYTLSAPAGIYRELITSEGFSTSVVNHLVLSDAHDALQNVTLSVGSAAETVSVSADGYAIETGSSATGWRWLCGTYRSM